MPRMAHRGARQSRWRRIVGSCALAVVLAVAADARADLLPPRPPACTGSQRGDRCATYDQEPGACTPVGCSTSSRDWSVAKGASECLACELAPDPPLPPSPPEPSGDARASTPSTSAAPTPRPAPAEEPPPTPVPASQSVAVPVVAGAIGVVVIGGVVVVLLRRRRTVS
jgi:hypothetical protein